MHHFVLGPVSNFFSTTPFACKFTSAYIRRLETVHDHNIHNNLAILLFSRFQLYKWISTHPHFQMHVWEITLCSLSKIFAFGWIVDQIRNKTSDIWHQAKINPAAIILFWFHQSVGLRSRPNISNSIWNRLRFRQAEFRIINLIAPSDWLIEAQIRGGHLKHFNNLVSLDILTFRHFQKLLSLFYSHFQMDIHFEAVYRVRP